jgi:5-methylcytosine-specific restriction endonuclease McrA
VRYEDELTPAAVKRAVDERDAGFCRLCGGTAAMGPLARHHIEYRSGGGADSVDNLVTLHFMYWPRCHERAHSNKRLWRPLLQAVIFQPGVTALQLRRWASPR